MGRKAALILRVATMIAVGSVGLRAEIQAPEACAARQTLPAQVRPLTCRTAARMIVGMARSATLRRVIDRLGELNGIVYIKDAYYVDPRTGSVLSGALSHEITMAGTHRVLHVTVAPESGDLQHQRHRSGRHQCGCPDQIEVYPGAAQYAHAELLEHQHRDEGGHSQIAHGVKAGGEECSSAPAPVAAM